MPGWTTIISTDDLFLNLDNDNWVVVDCRFSLADTGWGCREYLEQHIPGAVFADLDRHLSGTVVVGKTSRHPLPPASVASSRFSGMGVGDDTQVVAYDDAGGSLAAGRLWWMLRWLGHEMVAILDGGWGKWLREGKPVRGGEERNQVRVFNPRIRSEMVVTADQVEQVLHDPDWRIIDARAQERFHGFVEPIDPVAGHIPGAGNLPYEGNLAEDGTFRTPQELRRRFTPLLENTEAGKVIHYCGSGVTSIHNLLAMEIAGLGESKLYAGSWSEWITDPQRPIRKQES